MRIDRINLTVDTDDMGRVRSAGIYFENMNELGDRISGTFGITPEQYADVQAGKLTIKDIANDRIVDLFEITEDQDAMVGVMKLRKDLEENDKSIKALTAEIETQTMLITELTLLFSNLGIEDNPIPEEVEENEGANNEIPNPDDTETGGEGGE